MNELAGHVQDVCHVPLHVHTEYSLLDGASQIPDLVKRAKELNMSALAITDHGVMFGCYEMLQECIKAGVKPILGSEVYVMNGSHLDKTTKTSLYHLVLLAKNDTGYKNLVKIVSEANINGFYYKPRVSKEFLKEYSEGLVCLSACAGGEVPNLIIQNRLKEAREAAKFYKELYKEDFYIEIQDHGFEEDENLNKELVKLAGELGCKIVATNDSHYTKKSSARAHDAILCLQTGKLVSDFPRMHFSGTEHLKSGQEMLENFNYLDSEIVKKAVINNTLEITDKIESYELLLNTFNRMPKISLPEGQTNESYLKDICIKKLSEKYNEITPEITERLEYELKVINDSGFAGYFLIVSDFINFAKENDIPVGPGRGSAAGSIVAYVLGITSIDPLRFNLLFERFLNPERKSMPDIDTDFCIERRSEVIDYVRKLYGDGNVAQIITFNRLTSKAVIKDVARVLNYAYSEAEVLAKAIPVIRGKPRKITWMIENHPEFKKIYETNQHAREVIDLAIDIEGTNKSYGVHAAGVIISDVELTELVPLARSKEGGIITQYSMDHLANLGLLKMDFLGLRNLTTIYKTLDIIKETTGKKIDIENLPLDDAKVYELLSQGELVGIFQLETSSGMKQVARDMKPNCIEDLSAIIALYRPGPLDTGMIEEFIDRKQGRKKIEYKTPELEPILKDTYGTIVYQEQIMQIAQRLAGFSLGQADLLRRAMGKKKPEEMMKYKEIFLAGTEKNKIDSKVAEELFEMMMAFAEYCFNKSHSAAYALISYQTAWLKTHYPVEYLTALLSSVSGDQDKVRIYIAEAQRMGISVLPPHINISGLNFTAEPENKQIRFGLTAVKGVGNAAVEVIFNERKKSGKFESVLDLCKRVDLKAVNKKSLENLILSGAMSGLNTGMHTHGATEAATRKTLFESLDSVIRQASKHSAGQTDLFGLFENIKNNDDDDEINSISNNLTKTEYSSEEINRRERELLGFYVTGHPMAKYVERSKFFSTGTLDEIKELEDGSKVTVPILLTKLTKKMTKSNKLMAIGEGEDLKSRIELVFFSQVLEQFNEYLKEQGELLLTGKLQAKGEEDVSLSVSEVKKIESLSYLELKLATPKRINSGEWQSRIMKLRAQLKSFSGSSPVVLKGKGKESLVLDQALWVDTSKSDELIPKLKENDWLLEVSLVK